MTAKHDKSLEDLLASKPQLVEYFYNDTLAPHVKARPGLTPVPLEQTNWMEEQRAWRNTAVLFDQSHHMPELFLRGPDAMRLLSRVGINSLRISRAAAANSSWSAIRTARSSARP